MAHIRSQPLYGPSSHQWDHRQFIIRSLSFHVSRHYVGAKISKLFPINEGIHLLAGLILYKDTSSLLSTDTESLGITSPFPDDFFLEIPDVVHPALRPPQNIQLIPGLNGW